MVKGERTPNFAVMEWHHCTSFSVYFSWTIDR